MRDACEDGARARDARGEGRGELAWGGEGRGPKRTAVKHPPLRTFARGFSETTPALDLPTEPPPTFAWGFRWQG